VEEKMSVYEKLSVINVNDKKSKKNNLDYLSWAFAWAEVKKVYPEANSKVYENEQGLNYHTDGHTAWVKVGMTIEGLEHIEYLPVMDYRNQSIPVEKITSMDVNKAIQRGLVKAIARHGLGLYIYANEDLPNLTEEQKLLEAEKQRLREIQPALNRAEELGYPNMELLKTKTKKEIFDIMTIWKATEGK
jgi:hypothetical protein